ncbi:MAG: HDIG domain-containing protein [Flavobacteriales bacterium]|nr:HDIG domain-containing protein [Flavobacteriales bacterium]
MPDNSIEKTVEEVFGLFKKHGNADYIGEAISQLEHACQAAQCAEKEGFAEEVILAALFHDIGHLCEMNGDKPNMGGYGVMEHEKLGADFLRARGFSENVAKLVQSHVAAKRYLCYADVDYYGKLSEASKKTLEYQGGIMSAEEAVAFEEDPLCATIIRMRHWDEMAKEIGVPLPNMKQYEKMAQNHLDNR